MLPHNNSLLVLPRPAAAAAPTAHHGRFLRVRGWLHALCECGRPRAHLPEWGEFSAVRGDVRVLQLAVVVLG